MTSDGRARRARVGAVRVCGDTGDFWLIFETRPYMCARAALAVTLWRLRRREEAVEHQRELIRLNPRDNQAIKKRCSRSPEPKPLLFPGCTTSTPGNERRVSACARRWSTTSPLGRISKDDH
jgi:hypothetical protein